MVQIVSDSLLRWKVSMHLSARRKHACLFNPIPCSLSIIIYVMYNLFFFLFTYTKPKAPFFFFPVHGEYAKFVLLFNKFMLLFRLIDCLSFLLSFYYLLFLFHKQRCSEKNTSRSHLFYVVYFQSSLCEVKSKKRIEGMLLPLTVMFWNSFLEDLLKQITKCGRKQMLPFWNHYM